MKKDRMRIAHLATQILFFGRFRKPRNFFFVSDVGIEALICIWLLVLPNSKLDLSCSLVYM